MPPADELNAASMRTRLEQSARFGERAAGRATLIPCHRGDTFVLLFLLDLLP